MRIVILPIGTIGDVRPYTALGIGLKQAGHNVRIATHENFRDFVSGYGLDFYPVSYPQELMTGGEMLKLVDSGSNFVSWMRQLLCLLGAAMKSYLDDCLSACNGAEAIIYSPFGWSGYHIAQYLGVPGYLASLQPMSRTRCFPAVWSPAWLRLGGYGNLMTHSAVEGIFWQVFRRWANRWRKETLKLPAIPFSGPFGKPEWKEQQAFLYGFSSCVIPKPDDWHDNLHVTGYWFLPPDNSWQPSPELTAFLDAGEPPVCVGFGSVPIRNREEITDMVIEALKKCGRRGILQIGRTGNGNSPISDNIYQAGWVPHDWLFPKLAAAVHHGGASTVANSLRAGVPSVIVPFAWDQPFWGRRIEKLGVGPSPIPRRKLTVDNLAQAITIATSNKQIAVNAAALGSRIRAEDGVARAVDIVSRH